MKTNLEWREISDIKGYEQFKGYKVSNTGLIYKPEKYTTRKRINKYGTIYSVTTHQKEGITKGTKNNVGYYIYTFPLGGGKILCEPVHKLVALAFIENPMYLSEVNHIDEDKENNNVENLEWCTHRYNMNYGTIKERKSKAYAKTYEEKVNIKVPTKVRGYKVNVKDEDEKFFKNLEEAGKYVHRTASRLNQVVNHEGGWLNEWVYIERASQDAFKTKTLTKRYAERNGLIEK